MPPKKPLQVVALTAVLTLALPSLQAQVTGGQANAAQAAASRAAAPQAAAAPAAPTAAAQQPAPSPSPAGRRDPFRPLVQKTEPPNVLPARLPPGKPGLVVGQLTIQGIVRSLNGEWIAVVDNNTQRAYFLYEGDELFNGVVARINEEAVFFTERFTDAAGRSGTREVVKRLNPN